MGWSSSGMIWILDWDPDQDSIMYEGVFTLGSSTGQNMPSKYATTSNMRCDENIAGEDLSSLIALLDKILSAGHPMILPALQHLAASPGEHLPRTTDPRRCHLGVLSWCDLAHPAIVAGKNQEFARCLLVLHYCSHSHNLQPGRLH